MTNHALSLTLFALASSLPVAAQNSSTVVLKAGTPIVLETVTTVSSKTHVKGDLIALRVSEDVSVGNRVLIAKGSPATGHVVDARAKGALGMSGKLSLRPLYTSAGGRTIRLGGQASDKGSVEPGAVVGMAILSPGFTGRSASIPAGTHLTGYVERSVEVVP